MQQLTVGCMASEEVGGCISPGEPASPFWLIRSLSRRETGLWSGRNCSEKYSRIQFSHKLNNKPYRVSLSSQICLFCVYCMYIGYQFTLENKLSHCLLVLPNPKLRLNKTFWQQGGVYHMWGDIEVLHFISLSLNLLVWGTEKLQVNSKIAN